MEENTLNNCFNLTTGANLSKLAPQVEDFTPEEFDHHDFSAELSRTSVSSEQVHHQLRLDKICQKTLDLSKTNSYQRSAAAQIDQNEVRECSGCG